MNQWFATKPFAWLAASALLAPLVPAVAQSGEPAPATAPAVTLHGLAPATQDQAPAEAAWAVLQALRDYVHASQTLEDPQARTEGMTKARRQLMGLVVAPAEMEQDVLPTYVMLWPAVVAHYVDGFDRSRLTVLRADSQTIVTAVAANPHDQEVYDRLLQEITKGLQDQGYSGPDLAARRQTLLVRELARRGIGYPVAATVILTMQNVKGQWKAAKLDLRPPFLPATGSQPSGSQPARVPVFAPGAMRVQPKTLPAASQPAGAR